MADDKVLMPGPVLILTEVERSLAALDPDNSPENAGLAALARLYALTLAESGPTQNALKEIGPKLTAVLAELRKRPASAAPGLPTAQPDAVEPTEVEAARTLADPVAGVLDLERARVDRARRGRPA
jgi:hypothetical protein